MPAPGSHSTGAAAGSPAPPTGTDAALVRPYLAVGAAVVWFPLHRSVFAPVNVSVDAAHHRALVEWIRSAGGIPTSFHSELGGQSKYPDGAHVLAAYGSWVARIPAGQAMWLVSFGWALLVLLTAAPCGACSSPSAP